MKRKKKFTITSKVWLWPGDMAAWHFAGIDKKLASEITELYGKNRRGFGSLPVMVKLGKTSWKTSIFPDSRSGTYLLPLKVKVRKAEDIYEDDEVTFTIDILI
ncbi:DUF1905 domain-containing protein [Candidatus Parcubacteria bacterium]|uniref:DUF1905 domain-containing protein n=1 Tax=Candidatus Kaiserbacteria bacterium CG10_big_fil_rev_8_21_14_0_10_47_16 TaxID=1974608 RepID=A0A2H0UD64_9BACT|nr:DUF1905 domain-containing protein [Candidatus Parcubacteria bacterium]PIR84349.1 MAG: DUF1905 domain-containing protein [Candidatus Kaiserbacteria bacterium CG10_big_fil_rev_8_21_14_0_10_47_16]